MFKDLTNELNSNNNTELNYISQNNNNSNYQANNNLYEKEKEIDKNKENKYEITDFYGEVPVLRSKGNKNESSNNDNNIKNTDKEELEYDMPIYKEEKRNTLLDEQNNKEESEKKENTIEKEIEEKKEIQNEIYTRGEKIRSKIMERIKKVRAKSSDNKNQKDTKSKNILMKAQLLEKVLGNMKKPEDINNNYTTNQNTNEKNQIIGNDSVENQSENIPLVKKKKMKKNLIPFEG